MAANIPLQKYPDEKRVQKRPRATGLNTLFKALEDEDEDNGGVTINPAPKRPILFNNRNPNPQQPQIPALPPTPEATQRFSQTPENHLFPTRLLPQTPAIQPTRLGMTAGEAQAMGLLNDPPNPNTIPNLFGTHVLPQIHIPGPTLPDTPTATPFPRHLPSRAPTPSRYATTTLTGGRRADHPNPLRRKPIPIEANMFGLPIIAPTAPFNPNLFGGPPTAPPPTTTSASPSGNLNSLPLSSLSLVPLPGTPPKLKNIAAWAAGQDPTLYPNLEPTTYPDPGGRHHSTRADVVGYQLNMNGVRVPKPNAGPLSLVTPDEREAWLASEGDWKKRLGKGWKGTKVLGAGGYGICGLWQYSDAESESSTPGAFPVGDPKPGGKKGKGQASERQEAKRGKKIMKVVVKQVCARPDSRSPIRGLLDEAAFLEMFKGRDTSHIVRMFKTVFVEHSGLGTVDTFDAKGREIARMFLEYCEGGDMADFLKMLYMKYTAQNPIPEELIWLIFTCLALGVHVIEHGTEDVNQESWDKHIVHFDLKPQNILLGNNDKRHPKMPIAKIADFGLALKVPNVQSSTVYQKLRGRGTSWYFVPEQVQRGRFITPQASIFQIGKIMYHLITRSRSFNPLDQFDRFYAAIPRHSISLPTEKLVTKPTLVHGKYLLDAPYSVALRALVLGCLAVDPEHRLTAKDVVMGVQRGLEACESAPKGEGFGRLFEMGREPDDEDDYEAVKEFLERQKNL